MAVSSTLNNFASSTTAHGLAYTTDNRHTCMRFCWAILFIAALIICCFLIYPLWLKYFQYPVTEESKIIYGELEFPTISICNLNRFRKSKTNLGGESFVALLEKFEKTTEAPAAAARKKRMISFGVYTEDCKHTKMGTEYVGSLAKTQSGIVCQKWVSQRPHPHDLKRGQFPDRSLMAANNYCRNPTNYPEGPWCYTTDRNIEWEYCDVKMCPGRYPESTLAPVKRNLSDDKGATPAPTEGPGTLPDQWTTYYSTPVNETTFSFEPPATSPPPVEYFVDFTMTSETETTTVPEDSLTAATPHNHTKMTKKTETTPLSTNTDTTSSSPFSTTDYQGAMFDPTDSVFVPTINYTAKPWLLVSGEDADPFVQNSEELMGSLRDIPIDAQRAMGSQVYTMIQECVFSGVKCSAANFTGFSSKSYGNCYTFNSGHETPLIIKKQGSMYGLTLTLFVEQNEYIGSLSPAIGFRVLLYHRELHPFPEDGDGFNVSPGSKISVNIRMRKKRKLPYPYSNCTDGSHFKSLYKGAYSVAACQRTCIQMHTKRICGCGDPGLAIVENIRPCGKTLRSCYLRVKEKYENGILDCDCPEPCSVTQFIPSVAVAEWPAVANEESIIEELAERGDDIAEALRNKHGVRKNLLKIEFFYDDLRREEISQYPAYQIANLLSDIGGQMGIWLGVSVLTIVEFVQLIGYLTKEMLSKNKKGYEDMDGGNDAEKPTIGDS